MNHSWITRNMRWIFPLLLFIAEACWTPYTASASECSSADVEVSAVLAINNSPSEIDAYATAIENEEQWLQDCGYGFVGVEGDLYQDGFKIDWAIDAEDYASAEATMADPYSSGSSYSLTAIAYWCLDAGDEIGNLDQGTWGPGCYAFNDGNSRAYATYP